MAKQGPEAEQMADDVTSAGAVRSYTDGVLKEELQGVYSKLFTRPPDSAGPDNLRRLCALLAERGGQQQQQQGAEPPPSTRDGVNGLLSSLYSQSVNGMEKELKLSDLQWECLNEAFLGDSRYAVLRHIQPVPQKAASRASMKVGPQELAVIYHALLGQVGDESAANRLHDMKVDARNPHLSDEDKRTKLKQHLAEVYKAASGGELDVDSVIVDAMITMLKQDKYLVLEPYSGDEQCLIEGQNTRCY